MQEPLALEIAAGLASGRPVLGNPARPPISVLYVDMENSQDDIRERLQDLQSTARIVRGSRRRRGRSLSAAAGRRVLTEHGACQREQHLRRAVAGAVEGLALSVGVRLVRRVSPTPQPRRSSRSQARASSASVISSVCPPSSRTSSTASWASSVPATPATIGCPGRAGPATAVCPGQEPEDEGKTVSAQLVPQDDDVVVALGGALHDELVTGVDQNLRGPCATRPPSAVRRQR